MKATGKFFDRKGHKYSIWVVPALFCAVQYINDQKHLQKNREETENRGTEARKPNLQFKSSKTMSREDFTDQELVQMGALKKNRVGEELFLGYGRTSIF